MNEEEVEEVEEEAEEEVGVGEVCAEDELFREGLPLLARLWRLEEALAPIARGIRHGGR